MDMLKKTPLLLAAVTAIVIGSFAAQPAFAEDGGTDSPKFSSRQERHEYFQKLREEDPEQFKEVMEKRREHWTQNHPGQDGPRGPRRDFRENRFDRREDVRDRNEDRRDYREDRYDRREDRWDANHGPDRGRPGRHPGRSAGYRS
jgi:hypothetical protein